MEHKVEITFVEDYVQVISRGDVENDKHNQAIADQ